MTQQAVMEATRVRPAPAGGETADRDTAGRDPGDRVTVIDHPGDEALIADELLVEEVSIDGMCGVY
jgi:mycofactocin precursor